MDLEARLKADAVTIDQRLSELLPAPSIEPRILVEAMRYSCLAPGKRLRPILCLESARVFGQSNQSVMDAACALEMVHCFSLIHDDLPAIDNDDLRRGMPTCHVKFGESTAILAGDALFALAFEVLAGIPEVGAACCRELARCSGIHGLVAGEMQDILSEGSGSADRELLQTIHLQKTAALLASSCVIGGLCSGANTTDLQHLRQYGTQLGLAFQIADDLLNVVGSPDQLGKATGSDAERGKLTYPALFGVEESKRMATEAAETAKAEISQLGGDTELLCALADYAVERHY